MKHTFIKTLAIVALSFSVNSVQAQEFKSTKQLLEKDTQVLKAFDKMSYVYSVCSQVNPNYTLESMKGNVIHVLSNNYYMPVENYEIIADIIITEHISKIQSNSLAQKIVYSNLHPHIVENINSNCTKFLHDSVNEANDILGKL